jgi:hypothetical protein
MKRSSVKRYPAYVLEDLTEGFPDNPQAKYRVSCRRKSSKTPRGWRNKPTLIK